MQHKEQLKLIEMSLVLQVFGREPKCWVNDNFDLLVKVDEMLGITKIITVQPVG